MLLPWAGWPHGFCLERLAVGSADRTLAYDEEHSPYKHERRCVWSRPATSEVENSSEQGCRVKNDCVWT